MKLPPEILQQLFAIYVCKRNYSCRHQHNYPLVLVADVRWPIVLAKWYRTMEFHHLSGSTTFRSTRYAIKTVEIFSTKVGEQLTYFLPTSYAVGFVRQYQTPWIYR